MTVSDAVAILQYVGNSDKFALDGEALSRADVYMRGDGVTARDALSVMMYDAGLLASLPESWMEEPPTEAATEELTEPTTEPPAELEEVEPISGSRARALTWTESTRRRTARR